MTLGSSGALEQGWPISVKGVLGWNGRFVVLRNPRDEWELPGGRLDPEDADLPSALRREIEEELNITATIGPIIDSWVYDLAGKRVVIVTYGCTADEPDSLWHSEEHSEVAMLTLDELRNSPMPDGYLRSITAFARLRFLDPSHDNVEREPGAEGFSW